MTNSSLGGKGFICLHILSPHIVGSWGKRSNRAGTWRWELIERLRRIIAFPGFLSLLSHRTKNYQLSNRSWADRLGEAPTSISNQENTTHTSTGQYSVGIFSVEVFLSQMFQDYIKLKKKKKVNSQHTLSISLGKKCSVV